MLDEIISAGLMIIGALFMLVAAVGVYRMPDIYMRMAANSKSATLGAACTLLALAVHFLDLSVLTRAVATVVFLFMTAPIAAHAIGRAAYVNGCPRWSGTVVDELEGRYDTQAHTLSGAHQAESQAARASTEHETAS
jgi:multicomponent Na+:H+ antiporter subunit G